MTFPSIETIAEMLFYSSQPTIGKTWEDLHEQWNNSDEKIKNHWLGIASYFQRIYMSMLSKQSGLYLVADNQIELIVKCDKLDREKIQQIQECF